MNQLKLHISLLKSIPPNSMAPFLLFSFEFSYTASITSSETFTNSKVVIMMFSAYAIVTSREVILARYLYNHLRNYTKILYANALLPTTIINNPYRGIESYKRILHINPFHSSLHSELLIPTTDGFWGCTIYCSLFYKAARTGTFGIRLCVICVSLGIKEGMKRVISWGKKVLLMNIYIYIWSLTV